MGKYVMSPELIANEGHNNDERFGDINEESL
jgi:hypothetical protein